MYLKGKVGLPFMYKIEKKLCLHLFSVVGFTHTSHKLSYIMTSRSDIIANNDIISDQTVNETGK
jgi:hypothetical protein